MTSALSRHTPTFGMPALIHLKDQYRECEQCPSLCAGREQVVFGSGSTTAHIVVVGQAPGTEEDRVGESFVGPAGRLLIDLTANIWPDTEVMAPLLDLEDEKVYFQAVRDILDEHIYWTNVALCYPEGNRLPSRNEMNACRDRLHRVIYAVDPILIIAAGKAAASALVGKVVQITSKRGRIFDININSPVTGEAVRYPMMAMLHPSFALRKGDAAQIKKKKGATYGIMEDLSYAFSLIDELGVKLYDEPLLLS